MTSRAAGPAHASGGSAAAPGQVPAWEFRSCHFPSRILASAPTRCWGWGAGWLCVWLLKTTGGATVPAVGGRPLRPGMGRLEGVWRGWQWPSCSGSPTASSQPSENCPGGQGGSRPSLSAQSLLGSCRACWLSSPASPPLFRLLSPSGVHWCPGCTPRTPQDSGSVSSRLFPEVQTQGSSLASPPGWAGRCRGPGPPPAHLCLLPSRSSGFVSSVPARQSSPGSQSPWPPLGHITATLAPRVPCRMGRPLLAPCGQVLSACPHPPGSSPPSGATTAGPQSSVP